MTGARRRRAGRVLLPVTAGLVAVGCWWALTGPVGVAAYLLPSPVAVVDRLASDPGLYGRHVSHTLGKILVGGSVGAAAGFALGLAIAYLPPVRRGLGPFLVTARILPTIAVAPLLLLYLGTGFTTAVVFVAIVTFFPMVVNTAAGLQRVGDRHLDLLHSVAADSLRASLSVRLPFAVPDLLAGLKQTVTVSVVGALVAEWVVADRGLGYLVLLGAENVQPDLLIAAAAVLVAIGLVLFGLVDALGRLVSWRRAA